MPMGCGLVLEHGYPSSAEKPLTNNHRYRNEFFFGGARAKTYAYSQDTMNGVCVYNIGGHVPPLPWFLHL